MSERVLKVLKVLLCNLYLNLHWFPDARKSGNRVKTAFLTVLIENPKVAAQMGIRWYDKYENII